MPLPPGATRISKDEYYKSSGNTGSIQRQQSRGLGRSSEDQQPSGVIEDYLANMFGRFTRGTERMTGLSSLGEFLGGATDVTKAGLMGVAPVALTAGAVTAPVATAVGIAGGMLTDALTETALDYLPIEQGYKDFLGLVSSLPAGVLLGGGAAKLGQRAARGRMMAGLKATDKSRAYGKDVGTAALQETSGIQAEKILESTNTRLSELNSALDKIVSSGETVSLKQPREMISKAKAVASGQNNKRLYDALSELESRLYQNQITGKPIPQKVDAKLALELKRGVGNEWANFGKEAPTGFDSTVRSLFKSIGDQVKTVNPQVASIDESLSNLIEVKSLANRLMKEPTSSEASGLIDLIKKNYPNINRGLARALYGASGGTKTVAPQIPDFLKRLSAPEPEFMNQAQAGWSAVGSEFSPEARMAKKMLPAPNTNIGVSGVTMPGTTASEISKKVNLEPKLLAAPSPGQPPVNVQGGLGNVGFGSQSSQAGPRIFSMPEKTPGYVEPQKFYELPTPQQKAQENALVNALKQYYEKTLAGPIKKQEGRSILEVIRDLQGRRGGY